MKSDGTAIFFSAEQQLDALNRITRITLADDHYWDYGYDSMNQVTSGVKRDPAGTALPGYTFAYGFDTIGNRASATRESTTEAYTPNDLNQVESINHAGLLHLLGSADASANVTLNTQSVSRADSLYYGTAAGTNSLETITIEARIAGAGRNGTDAVALIEGETYIPAGPTTRSHDESGNLREDARWLYTWDADGARQRGDGAPARACPKRHCREGGFNRVPSGRVKPQNRLIQMETRPALVAAGVLHQRLTFGYDSQSRRISKTVEHWDPSTSSFITQNSSLFLWDGWLLLAEINATTQVPIETYTWGPDISGSRNGSGGLGGLVFVRNYETGRKSVPLYGNNGNLWNYWETADNVIQAIFEYGPFGELLQESGPQANRLRHRFSTKPEDPETGFLYYGFRYYDPETGRWLNRDPIEEEGGPNLYGFVNNNPVNAWDYLGLTDLTFFYKTEIEPDTLTFGGRTFNGGIKTAQTVSVDTDSCSISQHFISIGITIEYDSAGAEIDRGRSSGNSIRASARRGFFRRNICTVRMRGNERNPLVLVAPGITYEVEIKIDTCKREYEWEVKHDRFPSHEFWGHSGSALHSFSHGSAGTSPGSLFPIIGTERGYGSESY